MLPRSHEWSAMLGVHVSRSHRRGTQDEPAPVHLPVLPGEVVRALVAERQAPTEPGGWIVDATLGAGGHSALLLGSDPELRIFGLDQDPEILRHARRTLEPYGSRVRLRRGRMSSLGRILWEEGLTRVVGVILDLGVSSLQFDAPERGFSFTDGPLDMRMDPEGRRTAAEIVNGWDESDLADLFFYEGGENRSRRIAAAIVEARRRAPFLRSGALAELVARVLGGQRGRTHPATRVFQALRRAVNEEGEELLAGLSHAENWLVDGGVLCVISFHSGEDVEVKRFFAQGAQEGRWRLLDKKPIRASREEVRTNRRSRSALLRSAVRLRQPHGPLERSGRPSAAADRKGTR